MTILLDPGHGSDTPGKRSPDGRFREYKFNRDIAARVVAKLTSLGLDPREWMEDVLLRIPGNENNRDALRELLPDRWAKQTNLEQLGTTWPNLVKLAQT